MIENSLIYPLVSALVNYLLTNAARELSGKFGYAIDGKSVLALAFAITTIIVSVYELSSKGWPSDTQQFVVLGVKIVMAWLGSIGVAVSVKKMSSPTQATLTVSGDTKVHLLP